MTPAQFLEFIVSVSIQATIIVCIAHWLCRIVEIPRLQCQLWNNCYLLLVLVVIFGAVLPHLRAPGPGRFLSFQIMKQVVTTETFFGNGVFVIWMTGACVSLLLLIREWIRVFQFLKSCRPPTEQEGSLIALTDGLSCGKNRVRRKKPVELLISSHLGSPFCCQWHKPRLVFPEFLLELPSEDAKFVARHELEHLASGHPLQLFIERIVAIFFWFHPVIWWASQQSSLAREYACDDVAVAERREIVSYLKILVAVAERGLSEEAEGAKLFFGRGASIVALRGRRLLSRAEAPLLSPPAHRGRPAQLTLTIAALAASFIWVPLDALASPRESWSPWPVWSAKVLRTFDIPARDFEPYEIRTRLYEISASSQRKEGPAAKSSAQNDQH
jgi:hypothetical protein